MNVYDLIQNWYKDPKHNWTYSTPSGRDEAIAQEEQNSLNAMIMDVQRQWSLQDAEAQDQRTRNLYNDLMSPEARVRQLQEAGLSVGLMYGQGGSGGSLTQGGATNATPSAVMGKRNVDQMLDINTKMAMAQVGKMNAETMGQQIQNELAKKDLGLKDQTALQMQEELKQIQSNIEKTKAETDKIIQDRLKAIAETANEEEKGKLIKAQTAYTDAQTALENLTITNKEILDSWAIYKIEKECNILIENGKKLGIENDILLRTKNDLVKKVALEVSQAEWVRNELSPAQLQKLNEEIKGLGLENQSEEAMQKAYDDLVKSLGVGEDGQGKGFMKAIAPLLKIIMEGIKKG